MAGVRWPIGKRQRRKGRLTLHNNKRKKHNNKSILHSDKLRRHNKVYGMNAIRRVPRCSVAKFCLCDWVAFMPCNG